MSGGAGAERHSAAPAFSWATKMHGIGQLLGFLFIILPLCAWELIKSVFRGKKGGRR